jgi:predicted DNA-binding protein YlxM (UPF0122 family)
MNRELKKQSIKEQILPLHKIGLTMTQISSRIGMNYITVRRYCKNLGIKTARVPKESETSKKYKAEIIRYYMENHTLQETGNKYGVSREYVRQIIVKAGFSTRRHTAKIKPTLKKRKKLTSVERFWRRVEIKGEQDCWHWTGALSPTGYGWLGFRGKSTYAHRVSYMLHNKKSPKLHVLHSCDNRRCVNPSHLREGTQADNVRDRNTRGRGKWYVALLAAVERRESGISKEKAFEIRSALGTKPVTHIAKDFGVHFNTVHAIKSGKHWTEKYFSEK